MNYSQRNPLPVPQSGAFESLHATVDTVLDWQYELRRQNLLALYEKGKTLAWNANDLDWSIDVDPERMLHDRIANGAGALMNALMTPPITLSDEEVVRMQLHMNSFMLSQFLHGEQGALLATAKIVQSVPWEEAKFYAANQVADEARHVEVYHRYLTEKFGISYGVNDNLRQLLDAILCDSRWDVTFLGMQIMVEGLALAAFGVTRMQMADEPLIQDLIGRVMADESRHVAFGVLSLNELYTQDMSSTELREREDFVIEATHLLRDRLLMEAVFERLGWDVKIWVEWAKQTPFMVGFRQMMFSKIVPNLKRLGLLTPRVREAYAKLDLLKYESEKDSIEEPEVQPPHELVELMMQFLAKGPQNSALGAGSKPRAVGTVDAIPPRTTYPDVEIESKTPRISCAGSESFRPAETATMARRLRYISMSNLGKILPFIAVVGVLAAAIWYVVSTQPPRPAEQSPVAQAAPSAVQPPSDRYSSNGPAGS